jgi:hypothetical protein
MAIARVQSGTANSAGSSVSTLNIVLGSTPTAGNIVVVVGGIVGAFGSSGPVISATGIAFTILQCSAGSSVSGFIAVGRVHSGASATITITAGQAGGITIVAAEYSGANLHLDQNAITVGSGTSLASGATGTTEVADELWIGGLIARNAVTFSSPTNSFSIVAQDKSALATTSDRSVALLERIVTSTGTANAGATIGTSGIWIAGAITLHEVSSSGGGGIMRPASMTGNISG